jgi:hypothetical protein
VSIINVEILLCFTIEQIPKRYISTAKGYHIEVFTTFIKEDGGVGCMDFARSPSLIHIPFREKLSPLSGL